MTTPTELRALADFAERDFENSTSKEVIEALRSAADHMDELIQSNEELELKVHALALMEKALEQAKRMVAGSAVVTRSFPACNSDEENE